MTDRLIVIKEALTSVYAASNIDVKELDKNERNVLLDILNGIEKGTTKIRDGVNRVNREDEERKVVKHRSHNSLAPAECGRLWDAVKKRKYEKIVLWFEWDSIPKRQRCRLCRIGNREITGTEKERKKLLSNKKRSRKAMGWD